MPVEELPEWLDKEELDCINSRSEQISQSRDVIDKARDDIRTLLHDFGAEETEELQHPKVEQVNRLNLPQFKRKIEAALDQQFSDDDETYYRQVAEMMDGCFKAYRGPGRYLHHLYADEVKLFRQSMDLMGKELNQLTEVIKISRIRIGRIEAIRKALERYNHVDEEGSLVTHQQNDLQNKKDALVSEQNRIVAEREVISEGPEVREYTRRLQAHEEEQRRVEELQETLDSLVRTALPIWRKALRIVQDERDREKEKLLDHLIQLAVLQDFSDPAFLTLVNNTAALLFTSIENESVPLKNSFEKSLFVDDDTYVRQITVAVGTWQEAERRWKEEQALLQSHSGAGLLASLNSRLLDVTRDIRQIDEEIGKSQGKVHHLDREKDETVKIITGEMRELTGGVTTVRGLLPHTADET